MKYGFLSARIRRLNFLSYSSGNSSALLEDLLYQYFGIGFATMPFALSLVDYIITLLLVGARRFPWWSFATKVWASSSQERGYALVV